MKKRGQTSVEFLIFMGIAAMMFLTFLIIGSQYFQNVYTEKKMIESQDLARTIKNEINLAAWVENGYSRTFQLPASVGGGQTYTVEIKKRDVTVKVKGSDNLDYDYTEIATSEINKGISLILNAGAKIQIKKEADLIEIKTVQ